MILQGLLEEGEEEDEISNVWMWYGHTKIIVPKKWQTKKTAQSSDGFLSVDSDI